MSQASLVRPSEPYDVWIGPPPDPKTGQRLEGARWKNPFGCSPEGVRSYLEWVTACPWIPRRARRELEGKALCCGCTGPCHGLVLVMLARGRSLSDIAAELREWVVPRNRELFG